MRLQKYLAQQGVASRRTAEQLILQGRVKVNDIVVSHLGTQVELSDVVEVDGQVIRVVSDRVYLLLNKPTGVLTTARDTHGRPTVLDLIPSKWKGYRLFPVGRLDLDTEGLLILTNDGDFAFQLTHPRFHVPKTYLALVKGEVCAATLERLRTGVLLDDGPTVPAEARLMHQNSGESLLEIILTEGRKRQVKRMCATVGHPVIKLVRVRFGDLSLQGLPVGQTRELTGPEVAGLVVLAGKGGAK